MASLWTSIYGLLTGAGRRRVGFIGTGTVGSVSEGVAMALPAWAAGINRLQSSIASVRLVATEGKRLPDRPNPWMSWRTLQAAAVFDLIHAGAAYLRGIDGEGLALVPARYVEIEANANGLPVYVVDEGTGQKVLVDAMSMTQIRDFEGDEAQPAYSRLKAAAPLLNSLKAIDDALPSAMKATVKVRGIIATESVLSDNQFEDFKKDLADTDNSGVLVANGPVKLSTAPGINLADASLPETRGFLVRELAAVLGTPSADVGGQGNEKYANQSIRVAEYVSETIRPLARKIADGVERVMGITLDLDMSVVEQQNIQARFGTAGEAYTDGLLTLNEARARVGYSEVEDGDDFVSVPSGSGGGGGTIEGQPRSGERETNPRPEEE